MRFIMIITFQPACVNKIPTRPIKRITLLIFARRMAVFKSKATKSLIILIAAILLALALWDNSDQPIIPHSRLLGSYQTSSSRTSNVLNYCPVGIDRTSLAPSSEISTAQTNMNGVRGQLGIDGNSLMNKLLRGDLGGSLSMVMGSILSIAFFVGAFLVPFVVFLFIWPFLCCCCCCPASCPSKCCQQPPAEPYTRCQMKWPSAVLILSLLLVISVSIFGFMSVSKVGLSFQNMGCSLAIFTDDLLNGNITLAGDSFFTGLNIFSGSLTKLSNNLTTINSTFTDLINNGSGNSYTAVNNIIAVQNNYIKKIPDNAGLAQMNLVYTTPINIASTTGTLTSAFASALGQWSTNNTLLYKLYVSVEYARSLMQGIKNSSNIFSTQIATIQSQITPMQATLTSLISNVNSMDSSLSTFLSILNFPSKFGSIILQAFYGFLIGFSMFALLGVIMMCCCDKPGCRNLMYFSCIFIFLGALVAFLVSVLFSVAVPVFTWTCDFLTVASANSTSFQNNFGALLSNTTVNQISVCMPYGDGNIVNTVAGSAANGINNLTSVISSLKSFSNATLQSWIGTNLSALVSSANSYANGDILDLDTTNKNILAGFSDPSNTTNSVGCTSFTDSWVPSNSQITSFSTAIPCKSNAGTTGQLSNCNANFGPSGVCQGCMDTTQLLTLEANAAAVTSAVQSKYGATCAFAPILSNAWINYFNKKYTVLGYPTVKTQVAGTVMYRIQQAQTQIIDTTVAASVYSSIDSFRGTLNTVNTGLAGIQNLTDPTYGMLAGLNCKLFGEDFTTFQNVICGSFYNSIYIIRITFGIAAWGLLFAMCCITCSGVRHFKQIGKAKGNQVSDSSIINNGKNSFDQGSRRVFRGKNKYTDQY